jgi:hypothetical protein
MKNSEKGIKMIEFFKSEIDMIIFALTEIESPRTAQKLLGITKKHYQYKRLAKKWRDEILIKIHPDRCRHKDASKACSALNEIYEIMNL